MALEGSYEELYERAAAAILPHRLEEAIGQFRKLFDRLSGMSPELRSKGAGLDRIMVSAGGQLALLYRWQGDYAASLELLDRLSQFAPGLEDTWQIERAIGLIDSGAIEQGLDILRGLTMQHPDNRVLRLTLGQELALTGQVAEAERAFRRVAQDRSHKDEAFRAEVMRVNMQLEHGKPADVIAAWNRAIAIDPGARVLAPTIYDWHLQRGDVDGLEALLKQDGNSFRTHLYLGRIAAARGDKTEAERRWQKVLDEPAGGEWANLQPQIEAHLYLGESDAAIEILDAAVAQNLGGERTMVLYAIALVQTGEIDQGVESLALTAANEVRFRPRRALLEHSYWWLVQQYITDPDILARIRPYFDVQPEKPGDTAPAS